MIEKLWLGLGCLGLVTAHFQPAGHAAGWQIVNPGFPGVKGSVTALTGGPSGTIYAGGGFSVVGSVLANNVAQWNPASRQWSALGAGLNAEAYALTRDKAGYLYAGGYFTMAGGSAANYVAKWNASTGQWSALGTGMAAGGPGGPTGVLALACDGTGNLYAGGNFTTAGGATANYVAKWNPVTHSWSALGTGMDNVVNALACDVEGNLYAGGWFESAGGQPAAYLAVWVLKLNDGKGAWIPLPKQVNNVVKALAFDSVGMLYVGGGFSAAGTLGVSRIAKWNSSTNAWSALSWGLYDSVSTLLCDKTDNIYAGGFFSSASGVADTAYIAKWDPAAGGGSGVWSSLGKGLDAAAAALALDSMGNLYAGGQFSNAGGAAAEKIAQWTPVTRQWSTLGQGMNREVHALAFDKAGCLYAGGEFWTVDGVAASRIVKWEPGAFGGAGAWLPLGRGMSRTDGNPPFVTSLAFAASGNLYAGGYFTQAGVAAAGNIAKWNPAANSGAGDWFALGSGFDARVDDVALAPSGALYAGGAFTMAGAVLVNGVAKWDPAANGGDGAWVALGTGMARSSGQPAVYALACDASGSLYAGGWFDSAGGVANTRGIAKWNGSVWSPLGTGLTGTDSWVKDLLFDTAGNLYAGGKFATAGGVDKTASIAKWNPTAKTWSPLSDGVGGDYPHVEALCWDKSGNLYVGGRFSLVGYFISAKRLAKWSPASQTWSAVGGGVDPANSAWWDQTVSALAGDAQGNIYVGGDFTFAGTVLSPYLVRWGGPRSSLRAWGLYH